MSMMQLVVAKIIAPDSSHWAKWIDSAISPNRSRREEANTFYQSLLRQGKIPLLSWHHLSELLAIEDEHKARARAEFLRKLPLLSRLCLPKSIAWPGAITDVLAAEALTICAGANSPADVRDAARKQLLQTGPGNDVVGPPELLDIMRSEAMEQKPHAATIVALRDFSTFDDTQTVGEVARAAFRNPESCRRALDAIHSAAERKAASSSRRKPVNSRAIADEFMVSAMRSGSWDLRSVRDFIVSSYVSRGVDPEEVQDESRLSDLSELATFRSKMRVTSEITGLSFKKLKKLTPDLFPSQLVLRALREHGQHRFERPGSDLIDEFLAAFAPYCDVVYVDKRTHEDFRRVSQKESMLTPLLGTIEKAQDYTDLVKGPGSG
jgi:hypothetical protein